MNKVKKMKAKEMKEGMVVEFNGGIGVVTRAEHKSATVNVAGIESVIPCNNFRFITRI